MVEDPHHPPVFLRRGITRTKSSDENPLHQRPATANTSSLTNSPTMVVADEDDDDDDDDDTSITTSPPLCSPRCRAPPGRSVSVLVPGSTRTTTTSTSTSGTERRMGAPPNRTRSVLSSTRGSLSRTHTGDGMAEMALWRQEQLQLLQAKNNKQRTTATTLFLPDGGPSITPIVRTHSKITVLQKLREQRQQQQQEQQQQQQMLLLATQQKQQRVGLDKGEESDDGSSIIMAEFREGDEESETTNEDGSSSEEEDVYSSDGDGDDSDFDD